MNKVILESCVAGLLTLIVLIVVGAICYIAYVNTPNFIVQHSVAIFQGLSTGIGTFLAGYLLRRIKVLRRILHKATGHMLFHEEK